MTTTAGRWVHLPTSGGAADRFGADQPGGSGLLQVAASNATLACREGGLRTLWEHFGSANVYKNLRTAGDVSTIDLDAEDTAGAYVRLVGRHRVRLHGETGRATRLHLACRALAPSTYTLGVVLAAMPDDGAVGLRAGLYATATTTSTSLVDLSATLTVEAEHYGRELLPCRGAGGVEELGLHTGVTIVVAAWCTSGASLAKGALYGVTVSVREP